MKRGSGPAGGARRRAAAVLMRRPELVRPLPRGTSPSTGPHADDASSPREARWKISDTLIMIVVALRVLLPYVLAILATVGVAWALWRVAFG